MSNDFIDIGIDDQTLFPDNQQQNTGTLLSNPWVWSILGMIIIGSLVYRIVHNRKKKES